MGKAKRKQESPASPPVQRGKAGLQSMTLESLWKRKAEILEAQKQLQQMADVLSNNYQKQIGKLREQHNQLEQELVQINEELGSPRRAGQSGAGAEGEAPEAT